MSKLIQKAVFGQIDCRCPKVLDKKSLAHRFLKWLGADESVSVKLAKSAETTKFLAKKIFYIDRNFVIDITLQNCIKNYHYFK